VSSNKTLPQYRDDEVKVFHPLFADVLAKALDEMNLSDELEIVHHWTTKGFSGIIDFAVCNRKSKKVLLPIEVKKTVVDLKALGRRQARGYLSSLGIHRGSDFYVATNLEHVELFKDSATRVLTMAQLLKLDKSYVGNLRETGFDIFSERLKESLKQILGVVRGNDGSAYASNISGLLHALETSVHDPGSWHQAQSFYAYDYIRGALSTDSYFKSEVMEWEAAEFFIDGTKGMRGVVSKIDFDLLFEFPPKGRFNTQEIAQIVAGAFEAGQSQDNAKDLASVVNEIAYDVRGLPGVVETTPYLADLLLAHSAITVDLDNYPNMAVLEPGCGSGNLIMAAKKYFKSLTAGQILALEKQELFREILSLQVGLTFKDSLRDGERPDLSIRSIESVEPHECQNVGLVLMNPPFIRGIDCVSERFEISKRIFEVGERKSKLTGDQLGYECGYLELILSLVSSGTVISTVFPKNSLLRADSSQLRKFLIEEFGLSQIVIYKDNNLFGSVQKSTVLLVGTKGLKPVGVKVFNYSTDLDNLDFDMYKGDLRDKYIESNGAVSEIQSAELLDAADLGWKFIFGRSNSTYEECMTELLNLAAFQKLEVLCKLTRGTIGNKGASEFLFNPKNASLNSKENPPLFWQQIPVDWILPAAKNADSVPREITESDGESGIHIPDLASKSLTHVLSNSIFESYLEAQMLKSKASTVVGPQRKVAKSEEDLREILSASRPVQGNVVLIPRGQRAAGQITISSVDKLLVSTNFFIAFCDSRREAICLGSWLFSLFGQLQLEHSGIDQEGMRKLEKTQIEQCVYPLEVSFSSDEFRDLEEAFLNSKSVNFRAVSVRKIDEIWAQKLSPSSWEPLLGKVASTLQDLCNERLELSKLSIGA
jgi:N-6 DNA Methylase